MATRTRTIPARAIPALADVSQDIAGPLPVALLRDWTASERSLARATELLAPFRREGTVGASDTSGLSKLTQQRELLEVLWMVSQPKQILHAVGTGIGGQAIGVWVADNTEMFYPASIPIDDVVDAMIETQARIRERAQVAIGICLHTGVFYEIGGGLHGSDAQAVELLAEDYAHAEELLLTQAVVERVKRRDAIAFERRTDLDEIHPRGAFHVKCTRRTPALVEKEAHYDYPHGFPQEFFTLLRRFDDRAERDRIEAHLTESHQVDRFVVFVSRERTFHGADDLAAILDDFVHDAALRVAVAECATPKQVAESGGGLAIVVFESGNEALDFAKRAREKFQANHLAVKMGIDRGPVLLFERADGGSYENIAGDAVNLASKLSEDIGEAGHINITDRAAESMTALGASVPFAIEISHVAIRGITL